MRRVRLTTGYELELDGDILGVLEALYREVTPEARAAGLLRGHDEGDPAASWTRWARRSGERYLVESLFLNSVTYENEMLDAYMRRLTARRKKGRGRAPAGRSRMTRRCCVAAPGRSLRRRPPRRGRPRRRPRRPRPRIAVEPAVVRLRQRRCRRRRCRRSSCIRNFGDADLVIENVSTTCGCTVGRATTRRRW